MGEPRDAARPLFEKDHPFEQLASPQPRRGVDRAVAVRREAIGGRALAARDAERDPVERHDFAHARRVRIHEPKVLLEEREQRLRRFIVVEAR